jgi:type IV secretory pathway VirB3-like protein
MKRLDLVACATLVICVLNVLVQYLCGGEIRSHILNSDTLFYPALLSDVFAGTGHFSDWSLPAAPYFFPDLIAFTLGYLAGLGADLQLLGVALVQLGLVFIAMRSLAKETSIRRPFFAATFILAVLSYLALANNKPFDFISGGPFVLLLVSVFHFGAFLSTLIFLPLWLKATDALSKPDQRYLKISLLALLSFLATSSDSFFMTQTISPLIVMVLSQFVLKRREPWRLKVIPLLVALLASVAGFFSNDLLLATITRPSPSLGLAGSEKRLEAMASIFISVITTYPIFILVFLSYIIVVITSALRFLKSPDNASKLTWLAVFSLLSVLSTVTALALLTNIPEIGARYLLPVFFWPVIVVLLFFANDVKGWFTPCAVALSIFLMLRLSIDSYHLVQSSQAPVTGYSSDIACIDETLKDTDARHGLAQYWDARYVQTFSKLKISVAQYTVDLQPIDFFTSTKSFRPRYDFAISSRNVNDAWQIPPDALVRKGGEPTLVKRCGSRTVYVFTKNGLKP